MANETPDYNLKEKISELRSRYSDDVEFLVAARDEIVVKDSVNPSKFTEVMAEELIFSEKAAKAWPSIAKSISTEESPYGSLIAGWASISTNSFYTVKNFIDQENTKDPSKTNEFNKNVNDFYNNYIHKGNNVSRSSLGEIIRKGYEDSIKSYSKSDREEVYGGGVFETSILNGLKKEVLTSQSFVDIMELSLSKRVFDNSDSNENAIPITDYETLLLDACANEKLSTTDCGSLIVKILKEKDDNGKPLIDNSEVYYRLSQLVQGGDYDGNYELKNKMDETTFGNFVIESFKYNVDKDADFIDYVGNLQSDGHINSSVTTNILQETAKYYTAENYGRNLGYASNYLNKEEILSSSLKIFNTKSTEEEGIDESRLKTDELFEFYDRYLEETESETDDKKFTQEDYLNQIKKVAADKNSSKEAITSHLLSKTKEFGKDKINVCIDQMYDEGSITFGDKLRYDILGTYTMDPPIKNEKEFIEEIKNLTQDQEKRKEIIEILKSDTNILNDPNINSTEVLKSLKDCFEQREIVEIANSTFTEHALETDFIKIYDQYGKDGLLDKNIVFEDCTKFVDENTSSVIARTQYKDLCDELYKEGVIDSVTYKNAIKKIKDFETNNPNIIVQTITEEDYKKVIDEYISSIDKDVNENKLNGKEAAARYKELFDEKSITEKDYKQKLLELYDADKINAWELRDLSKSLSDVSDMDIDNKIKTDYKSGKIGIPQASPMIIKGKGENETYSFDTGNWHDKILKYNFEKNLTTENKEIIDIINSYGWTINNYSQGNNIPHCYVVEYEQMYNASISNLLISLIGLIHTGKHMVDNVFLATEGIVSSLVDIGKSSLKSMLGQENDDESSNKVTQIDTSASNTSNTSIGNEGSNEPKSALGSFRSGTQSVINTVSDYVAKGLSAIMKVGDSPIGNSDILAPYRLMYILRSTGKKYCFPMMDKSSSSFKASNKMDEREGGEGSSLLGNNLFGAIHGALGKLIGWAQDIEQVAPFFSTKGMIDERSMKQYSIERSKFYAFPTDGEDIETTFVLYNTTHKDIWKKHYSFILGFMLRNLPFKQDMVSYYPPLFYDVMVPGVKHCPYCYVESFDVSPLGITRKLTLRGDDLGFNEDKIKDLKYQINVPEAWMIKIKFKSLLGTSANQILSSLIDSSVNTSLVDDSIDESALALNLHGNAQMEYTNTMA